MSSSEREVLLRRALTANGYFSMATGTIAALAAAPLSRLMEIHPGALIGVGVGVVVFGGLTAWTARQRVIDLRGARMVVWADVAWVVGAVALIAVPGSMAPAGKLILGAVSLFVAVFALVQQTGVLRIERGPKRIVSEVHIEGRPDLVWRVLTDMEEYRDWNPFIVAGGGEAREGHRLQLRMRPPGGMEVPMRPTVTQATVPRSFEWLGHLGVKGIFDGRHRFEIDRTATGARLTQSEEFTGLLVPLMTGMLDGKTKAGFEAMNLALKERVESIEAARS